MMLDDFFEKVISLPSLTQKEQDKVKQLYVSERSSFYKALFESGIVIEDDLLNITGSLFAIPVMIQPDPSGASHGFTADVAIQFLKKFSMVPLIKEGAVPVILMNDPSETGALDDLIRILQLNAYELALAPKSEILLAINSLYNKSTDSAQQLVDDMEGNGSSIIKEIEQTADLLDDTSDAPVIRLVNHMISQSVKANASDIHIEPFQESLNIRYRIDGILYDMLTPPKWIQSALISRVKVMANMNIAEKRLPQDGRMEVRIGEQEIDIRVSTVPTSFGERLVMRLLNKSGILLELSEFGIPENQLAVFNDLIRLNNGIVLVTGPTGSGKTTTLYAALSAINSPDKNIITIEDPVEYNLKGIGQIQVNRKIDVTFAMGLRSIVRQDPDVILVGEIRDFETAEIAIQSALTGHLVFSTLHTNDSAGAVTRLTDLGVEPYLITSSVKAVIAQRLIRVLCDQCKEPYKLGRAQINTLSMNEKGLEGATVFKAVGCSSCFHTGYTGRQVILEIMTVDDRLKSTILSTSDSNRIREEALGQGMVSLRNSGIKTVLKGISTVEEVLRVTQD